MDVTHIRPFYYDPAYVTPLTIAVKDTDETVVGLANPNPNVRVVHLFGSRYPDIRTDIKEKCVVIDFISLPFKPSY